MNDVLEDYNYDYNDEYIIIDSYDLYNFIYKVDISGTMEEKSLKKNNYPDDNDTYISYFDLENYINDVKKAYKSDECIFKQYKTDFKRQYTKLNGIVVEDIDELISKLKNELHINEYQQSIFNISFYNVIILLSCQSSFALPYIILKNVYKLNDEDNILVSGSRNKISTNIDITIEKENLSLKLNSILNIKNVQKNTNTHKIEISICCDFQKNMEKNEPHFGIFTWIITRENTI